eukprot:gene8171-9047_t
MAKPNSRKRFRDITSKRKGLDSEAEVSKAKSKKWTNKQRVLVFCQRGISHRARHLMLDLRTLMPHSRADNKLEKKDKLDIVNEVCEMKNCNKCIFFEMKKKKDLFLWMSNVPHGPSAKFLVENIHTMDELKLTGNCLKGSRPLLSFEKVFNETPHNRLLKELIVQIFNTPNLHPKSKPFFDHVFNFSIVDNRIWFRNYQIEFHVVCASFQELARVSWVIHKCLKILEILIVNQNDLSLTEIGPRFVLNPIRIFSGSFGGPTLYQNPHYVSPNEHRRNLRKKASYKYANRQEAQKNLELRLQDRVLPQDEIESVFHTVTQADILAAKNK